MACPHVVLLFFKKHIETVTIFARFAVKQEECLYILQFIGR